MKDLCEVVPPTVFFAVGFNLIVLTTNLILADYLTSFGSFIVATITALIVGKSVLVANAIPSCAVLTPLRLSDRSRGCGEMPGSSGYGMR
jgi:hypothetical protein